MQVPKHDAGDETVQTIDSEDDSLNQLVFGDFEVPDLDQHIQSDKKYLDDTLRIHSLKK